MVKTKEYLPCLWLLLKGRGLRWRGGRRSRRSRHIYWIRQVWKCCCYKPKILSVVINSRRVFVAYWAISKWFGRSKFLVGIWCPITLIVSYILMILKYYQATKKIILCHMILPYSLLTEVYSNSKYLWLNGNSTVWGWRGRSGRFSFPKVIWPINGSRIHPSKIGTVY